MTAQLRALGVTIVALLLAGIATVVVQSGDGDPQAIQPSPTPTTPGVTQSPTVDPSVDPTVDRTVDPTVDPTVDQSPEPRPSPTPASNEGPRNRLPNTGGPSALLGLLLFVPGVAVAARKYARSRRAR